MLYMAAKRRDFQKSQGVTSKGLGRYLKQMSPHMGGQDDDKGGHTGGNY